MCDLNWCPVCDKSIPVESDSLYCSVNCYLEENSSVKKIDLISKLNSFLPPKSYNVNTQISDKHYVPQKDSIKTPGSLSTMTLDSLLSVEEETDDEDDRNFLSCCDYCENKMDNEWGESFVDICPSYNPLWAEKMPGMEGS